MADEYSIVLNAKTNLYEVVERAGLSMAEFKKKVDDVNRSEQDLERQRQQAHRANEERLKQTHGMLDNIRSQHGKGEEAAKRHAGGLMEVGKALGVAFTVHEIERYLEASFKAYATVQDGMNKIQRATGASREEMEKYREAVEKVSARTGEEFKKLNGTMGELMTTSGLVGSELNELFEGVGANARLAGSSVSDMARATTIAMAQMKIPVQEANETMGKLTQLMSGDASKQFMGSLPHIIEKFAELGFKGKEAVESIGIAWKGLAAATGSGSGATRAMDQVTSGIQNGAKWTFLMRKEIEQLHKGIIDNNQFFDKMYEKGVKMGTYAENLEKREAMRRGFGFPDSLLTTAEAVHDKYHSLYEMEEKHLITKAQLQERIAAQEKEALSATDQLGQGVGHLSAAVGKLMDSFGASQAMREAAELANILAAGVERAAEAVDKLDKGIRRGMTIPGWMRGGTGSGPGGADQSLPPPPTYGFQHGGIVTSPTRALIGEAGPEAIIPLGRGGGSGGDHSTSENTAAIKELTSLLKDSMRGGGRAGPFRGGGGGGRGGGGPSGGSGGYSGGGYDYYGGSDAGVSATPASYMGGSSGGGYGGLYAGGGGFDPYSGGGVSGRGDGGSPSGGGGNDYALDSGLGTRDGGSGGGQGGGAEKASLEIGEAARSETSPASPFGPLGGLGRFVDRPFAYTPGAGEAGTPTVAGRGSGTDILGGGPIGRYGPGYFSHPAGAPGGYGAGGMGLFRPGIGPGAHRSALKSSSSSTPAAPGTSGGPPIDMRSARATMRLWGAGFDAPPTSEQFRQRDRISMGLPSSAPGVFGPAAPGIVGMPGVLPTAPTNLGPGWPTVPTIPGTTMAQTWGPPALAWPAAPSTGAAGDAEYGKGINRQWAADELAAKPWLKEKLMRIAINEGGGDPAVARAIYESMMNRAEMHKTSLEKEATWKSDKGYYDDRQHPENKTRVLDEKTKAALGDVLNNTITKNTNTTNYATENASGDYARGEIERKEFELRKTVGQESFMAPISAKSGWAPQYKKWLEAKQNAPDTTPTATAKPTGGTEEQGTMIFIHGLKDRYAKQGGSVAQTEEEARQIAELKGLKLRVVDTEDQARAIMDQPNSGVKSVVGFSAGANAIYRMKGDYPGVDWVPLGGGADGTRDAIPGKKHMQQVGGYRDQLLAQQKEGKSTRVAGPASAAVPTYTAGVAPAHPYMGAMGRVDPLTGSLDPGPGTGTPGVQAGPGPYGVGGSGATGGAGAVTAGEGPSRLDASGGGGVHPDLITVLHEASKSLPPGWTVKLKSGVGSRPGGSKSYHPHGLAADVEIRDAEGKPVGGEHGWYQDPATFRIYEKFAQAAKAAQVRLFPKGPGFAWGGYFANKGPGSYGFADVMHMQWGGPMGGGTWEGGAGPMTKTWLEAGIAGGQDRPRTRTSPGTSQGMDPEALRTGQLPAPAGNVTVGPVTSGADAKEAGDRQEAARRAQEAKKRKKTPEVKQSKDFSKSKQRQAKRDADRDAHENSVVDY